MVWTSNIHLTNAHLYANDVDLSYINTELTEETRDFACLTAGYPLVTRIVFLGRRPAFVQTPAGIVGTPGPHQQGAVGVRREDSVKRSRG